MSMILDYYEALERLIKNKPERLSPGTKITKDAVALEAGRRKGSIKKSRKVFAELIVAINEAAKVKPSPRQRAIKYKNQSANYRKLYEQALGREVILIKKIYELKTKLAKLTSDNVVPLSTGK